MKKTIIGESLPNIPWEDQPENCSDVLWRYSGNPILSWNPIPKAARMYNSAVLPHKGEFVGVFRADQKNGRATLFFGRARTASNGRSAPTPVSYTHLRAHETV